MPKTKRDYLKKALAQAYHDLERGLERIQQVYEPFSEQHPQHAEMLALIGQNVLMSQAFILDFWAKAWGKVPENLDHYRL